MQIHDSLDSSTRGNEPCYPTIICNPLFAHTGSCNTNHSSKAYVGKHGSTMFALLLVRAFLEATLANTISSNGIASVCALSAAAKPFFSLCKQNSDTYLAEAG